MTGTDTDLAKQILDLLSTPPSGREALFALANKIRRENMGDSVFLRGIVEFSNVCSNRCLYCGIRAPNVKVNRYRMADDEILAVARRMSDWKHSTIVLQSGEADSPAENRRIGELVRRIKAETPLAVTLSVGNRSRDVYAFWRECGMDRYLLRFETSDPKLFAELHPDCSLKDRLQCLEDLRAVGAQVGSGFLIGAPGETLETLANNILLCRTLDLDMIGVGPFIPHPDTPLAGRPNAYKDDTDMFFVAVSVLRIFNPQAHIPATTAFDAVFSERDGRDLVLRRGANVFMPNDTPQRYRGDYLLYPDKPCVDEDTGDCSQCVLGRLDLLGRPVGEGPGHTVKKRS
ncbi:MAG: [FeFe] hydrogenase H-cluster radical SAM maturase HydE [Alphaproteobacteria bacterium]|nr:[FeFe] hydrogenase H-cluster radical SAM maturase HydE [Alphaproteobacteria bacterium]